MSIHAVQNHVNVYLYGQLYFPGNFFFFFFKSLSFYIQFSSLISFLLIVYHLESFLPNIFLAIYRFFQIFHNLFPLISIFPFFFRFPLALYFLLISLVHCLLQIKSNVSFYLKLKAQTQKLTICDKQKIQCSGAIYNIMVTGM